jgi:hypothetical protein
MYESDAIIQYLFTTYGDGQVPRALTLGALTTLSAGLGQLGRCACGLVGVWVVWKGRLVVGSVLETDV